MSTVQFTDSDPLVVLDYVTSIKMYEHFVNEGQYVIKSILLHIMN